MTRPCASRYSASRACLRGQCRLHALWGNPLDARGRADVAPRPRPFRSIAAYVPCAGQRLLAPAISGGASRLGPQRRRASLAGFKEVSYLPSREKRPWRALSNRARRDNPRFVGGGCLPAERSPNVGGSVHSGRRGTAWFSRRGGLCSQQVRSMGACGLPGFLPTRSRRRLAWTLNKYTPGKGKL